MVSTGGLATELLYEYLMDCQVGTHCRLLRKPVLRSSSSSMGDEEDRREFSKGLQAGLLLLPCWTGREMGLSSRF